MESFLSLFLIVIIFDSNLRDKKSEIAYVFYRGYSYI